MLKKKSVETKKPEVEEKPKTVSMDQVVQGMQLIAQHIQRQNETIKGLVEGSIKPQYIKDIEEKTVAPKKEGKKEKEIKDIDLMSNRELLETVLEAVSEDTGRKIGELRSVVEKSLTTTEGLKVSTELEKIRATNKDFDIYARDVAELQERHPSLNISELYMLAKSNDPQRAEAFKKEQEAKEEPKKEEPKFRGLLSTSSAGAQDESLEFDDAIQKAWSELDMDAALAAANPN